MEVERQPMLGSVTVEGGTRATRIDLSSEAKWSELRTDPAGWDMEKPQLHEGRGGRPLIVLIGWNGHTAQQISHVVYYWQDLGCAVLRLTGGFWAEHDPKNTYSATYDLFHQYLRTYVMPNKGFIVHSMSSMGSTVLGHLVELDTNTGRDIFSYCRGVIYDSGPALRYPEFNKQAGRLNIAKLSEDAGHLTSAGLHAPLAPVISLLWTPIYLLVLLYYTLFYKSKLLESAEKLYMNLSAGLAGVRVLMIVSECDYYTSCDEARHFSTVLQGNESKVKVVSTDTAHCCHLLEAPEVIRPAFQEFLSKCVDD